MSQPTQILSCRLFISLPLFGQETQAPCCYGEKRFKEWPKFYHEIFNEPDREDVFEYAKDFVASQLKAIGYIDK